MDFKGFKLINGTAKNFDLSQCDKNSVLYFIRTNEDKEDGYLYFNGKKYGTASDTIIGLEELTDTVSALTNMVESIASLGLSFEPDTDTLTVSGKSYCLVCKCSGNTSGDTEEEEDEPVTPTNYTYYIGQTSARKSDFPNYSTDELLASATTYTLNEDSTVVTTVATGTCYYIILADGLQLDSCVYSSTTTPDQDVIAQDGFELYNGDDIVIDGITYKIYAVKVSGVDSTNTITYRTGISKKS